MGAEKTSEWSYRVLYRSISQGTRETDLNDQTHNFDLDTAEILHNAQPWCHFQPFADIP